MAAANTRIIIELLDYALVYGVPAVIEILAAWNKETITDEDVEALGAQMEMRDTDALRNPSDVS